MVEHAWIRIAELKEQAADEEWMERHPWKAQWRARLLYLRARCRLGRRLFFELEWVQRWLVQASHAQDFVERRGVRVYLFVTRCCWVCSGWRPRRCVVQHLSIRELMDELEQRALDHSHCVERGDLLELLCGPLLECDVLDAPADDAERMDKMV